MQNLRIHPPLPRHLLRLLRNQSSHRTSHGSRHQRKQLRTESTLRFALLPLIRRLRSRLLRHLHFRGSNGLKNNASDSKSSLTRSWLRHNTSGNTSDITFLSDSAHIQSLKITTTNRVDHGNRPAYGFSVIFSACVFNTGLMRHHLSFSSLLQHARRLIYTMATSGDGIYDAIHVVDMGNEGVAFFDFCGQLLENWDADTASGIAQGLRAPGAWRT